MPGFTRARRAAAIFAAVCAFEPGVHAQDAPGAAAQATPDPQSTILRGTGNLVAPGETHISQSAVSGDDGITLNFVNADVRDVAKAIFGDFLNVNYAIGAGVQGNLTVQTSKPLSRGEILPAFEQVLHINGMAIVRSGTIYKIVLAADAPREMSVPTSMGAPAYAAEVGYGSQIVPLRFVSAAAMQKLLESMQPSQAIVHADTGRNLLIIQGTAQERSAIVAEIELFDVDWLKGMSFGMFTPQYTDARGLAHELDQVLGGPDGPLAGVVKLIPLERLNTVLVVSPQAGYLDQVKAWVARLDKPSIGSDRRIFVYAVQNGRASDLAAVLKKAMFGIGGSEKDDNGGDDAQSAAPPPTASGLPSTPVSTPAPRRNASLVQDGNDNPAPPPGSPTVTADDTNNAIVVYGTPQDYANIENALHQLDVAPLQILLEAAIAEVTLTNDLQYGVQYFYQPSDKHQLTLSSNAGGSVVSSFPGFSYLFSQGSNIRVVLNTLSQVTHVEVMSSPEVMVLNNHTATLQVGDQVPVATSQAVSVIGSQSPIVNTIQYQPTGVILKVTPRVNQGGMVMMDISQEVSDVSNTTTSSLDSPTISERKIDSSVAVQDNETIALGGLIKNSKTSGSSGLPFLSEIPVLGGLFGTKSDNNDRTELIVLITPHVVDNMQKARAVTAELRQKLPAVQTLLAK